MARTAAWIALATMLLVPAPDVTAARCAPPRMLWAWERPERLADIDPATTGVAFLARTLALEGTDFTVRPRLQPLMVPPATYLVAVVRIEHAPARRRAALAAPEWRAVLAPPEQPAALAPPEQRAAVAATFPDLDALAAAIAAVARPTVAAVQIDFDAARSERPYYRELLWRVRRRLPPPTGLTMTALASWALGDAWLDGLPVDDVVPMLFRMGADDRVVRRTLAAGRDFASALARRSVGLAVDEPPLVVPPGRRLYLFNPRPWTLAEVKRWPAPVVADCASGS